MWNDEFLLGEDQFVYSENLDIYRDPRCIQLAVKPVNYKTGLPSFVNIIGDTGIDITGDNIDNQIFFAMENKDIIDALWTLRFDGSTARPFATYYTWRNFVLLPWSGLVFWDYVNGIFVPFEVTPAASDPAWIRDELAYEQDWTTDKAFDMTGQWLGTVGITRPVYTIGNSVFFGDSQDHWNIAITSTDWGMDWSWPFWPWFPTITAYQQGIDQPWEVVFASVHSDSVWSGSTSLSRVYTELSALWVIAWEANNGVKQLQIDKFTKFLHGVNYNNTDIIIGGDVNQYYYDAGNIPTSADYKAVYVYKHYGFGSDAQQLQAKSRYHPNIETAFDTPGVTFYLVGEYGQTNANWARVNDMIYGISTKDEYSVIYAYGRENGWVNIGWSIVVSRNSFGKRMKRIGTLYRNRGRNGFYYSYEDEDGVYGIDYYDDITLDVPTSYQSSGKIFLRTDDGGDMSLEKEIKELRIGCRIPEDTTMTISYILDNGVEQDYATITNTTQGTNEYKKYRGNLPVKGFKCISWFAEFTTTWTSTPQLFNFNYDIWIIQQ